jgi:hypothetical protein
MHTARDACAIIAAGLDYLIDAIVNTFIVGISSLEEIIAGQKRIKGLSYLTW